MGVGGLERQPDKQIGNKNMNEIYEMFEKYQAQGKDDNRQSPPIISKDQIVFSMKP
jgi:hypothetical protein